jgi:hypothetical protein
MRDRFAPTVQLFEMALYHGAPGQLRAGEFLGAGSIHRLDPIQRQRRARMIDAYRSQAATLQPFVDLDHECYRPAPAYDFSRPPHDGPLLYERWGMGPSGHAWRALVSRVDAALARDPALQQSRRCTPPLLGAAGSSDRMSSARERGVHRVP